MNTLEDILVEYFGATPPVFNEQGQLTKTGSAAYIKRESLVNDLNGIGISIFPDKIMNEIDAIIDYEN